MRTSRSHHTLVKIAKLHYEENLSQQAIADRLNLSISTISRALKQARQEGIVEIRVLDPNVRMSSIETELVRAFGLDRAIVVPTQGSHQATLTQLGRAVADYLEMILHDGTVVGVSDGMTTAAVASNLRAERPLNLQVVPLLGGVGVPNMPTHPIEVANTVARHMGGVVQQLNAPAMVRSSEVRQVLLDDPVIASAFDTIGRCKVALVGVGAVASSAAMVKYRVLTSEEMDEARQLAAVGAICARFYDAAGRPIESHLDARTISITLGALAEIPHSVAVAIGAEKADALVAGLRGRLVRSLGTDRDTAEKILERHRILEAGA